MRRLQLQTDEHALAPQLSSCGVKLKQTKPKTPRLHSDESRTVARFRPSDGATEVIAPMTGSLLGVFDPRNYSALERRQGKNLHVAVASGRDDLLFAEEWQEMQHGNARGANRDAP